MTRPATLTLLAALAFALAVVPTLPWLQFSSGGENLLVATVVEMRRPPAEGGGAWLVPTLNGEPRLRKPPLPSWISAALLPQPLLDEVEVAPVGPDRDRAFERVAYAMRAPVVVLACLIVLLVYDIGRTLDRPELGLAAAAVAASSLLLLRYGRSVTTDVHLAFWVTAANAALVRALAGRPAWRWLPLAGAAMGMAILSKGPVALAQSALPAAVCALALRRPPPLGSTEVSRWRWVGPTLAGAAACAVVALPWFAYVLATRPDAGGLWWTEVTRQGATTLEGDPWYAYGSLLPLAAPWTILFVVGLAICLRDRRGTLAGLWPVVAVLAPLVVMSLVKDKNERYLLPLVAPLAVATAHAILPLMKPWVLLNPAERVVARAHWGLLAVIAAGLPVAGAVAKWMPGGQAWWDWPAAAAMAGGLLVAWAAMGTASRWRPGWLVAGSMLLMFAAHVVFLYGYRTSPAGVSEMKPIADAIVAERPAAEVWYYDPRPQPKPLPQDLQIYLNRVVRVAASAERLPAPGVDRVVVMLRRERESPPTLAGWTEFARRPWGKRSWHALTGDPRNAE